MASGHVNRIKRPNTWLLRPGLRREESPCQRGAVHTWHEADTSALQRFRLQLGGQLTFWRRGREDRS